MMINQPLRPVDRTQQTDRQQQDKKADSKADFKSLLQERLAESDKLKFSNHAKDRLADRQIELSDENISKLTAAVDKAEAKGAKDSLVMVDDVAYVVSVENKTVITAMDDSSMKENVFTNIDSAVFM